MSAADAMVRDGPEISARDAIEPDGTETAACDANESDGREPVTAANVAECEATAVMPERFVLVANEATPADDAIVTEPDGMLISTPDAIVPDGFDARADAKVCDARLPAACDAIDSDGREPVTAATFKAGREPAADTTFNAGREPAADATFNAGREPVWAATPSDGREPATDVTFNAGREPAADATFSAGRDPVTAATFCAASDPFAKAAWLPLNEFIETAGCAIERAGCDKAACVRSGWFAIVSPCVSPV